MLMSNQEQLYFRFVDHVDFRVCQSTLRSLVPDGGNLVATQNSAITGAKRNLWRY